MISAPAQSPSPCPRAASGTSPGTSSSSSPPGGGRGPAGRRCGSTWWLRITFAALLVWRNGLSCFARSLQCTLGSKSFFPCLPLFSLGGVADGGRPDTARSPLVGRSSVPPPEIPPFLLLPLSGKEPFRGTVLSASRRGRGGETATCNNVLPSISSSSLPPFISVGPRTRGGKRWEGGGGAREVR